MSSRTPLIVGGVLLASVALGAIVMLLIPSSSSRLTAALTELRAAKSSAEKSEIRERIAEIPADPSLRPVLIKALSDGNETVRETAAVELRRVGLPANELLAAFIGRNRHLAGFAERTLSSLGPDDEALVPGLIEGLDNANVAVRQRAIVALGGVGPAAKAAVPKLTVVLREGDPISAQNAATALGNIGVDAADAVPALVGVIRDGSKIMVLAPAIEALGKIGEPARGAVPILFEHLKDTPAKGQTITALVRLHATSDQVAAHLPEFAVAMVDLPLTPDEFAATARLLAPLGEQARGMLPDLMRSAPTRTTGEVVAALRQIDPDAGGVLEAVCTINESPDDARAKAREACLLLNGRRLLFVPFRMTWEQARIWCEERGGRLVSIRDADEQNAITNYARKFERFRIYIGAADRRSEGTFQWEDDSPWTFSRWLPGEPNDAEGIEDYGEVYLDTLEGFWNDTPATEPRTFIIQWID